MNFQKPVEILLPCQYIEPCTVSSLRRKTRSPSPRRRSPVKRERKRSPSRSPRRKPIPVIESSPPPPLLQSSARVTQQLVEPDTSEKSPTEPVIQEASSTELVQFLFVFDEILFLTHSFRVNTFKKNLTHILLLQRCGCRVGSCRLSL